MERLSETTPSPPKGIINEFNREFKDVADIAMPSETNGLEKVKVYSADEENNSITPQVEMRKPPMNVTLRRILETAV
jgi:hypothetical protein